MSNDVLKIQTTALYTGYDRNTLRVLDNNFLLQPISYFAGTKTVPANTNTDMFLVYTVNNITLVSNETSFTVKIQKTSSVEIFCLENVYQFTYTSEIPINVFLQNPNNEDALIHVVHSFSQFT